MYHHATACVCGGSRSQSCGNLFSPSPIQVRGWCPVHLACCQTTLPTELSHQPTEVFFCMIHTSRLIPLGDDQTQTLLHSWQLSSHQTTSVHHPQQFWWALRPEIIDPLSGFLNYEKKMKAVRFIVKIDSKSKYLPSRSNLWTYRHLCFDCSQMSWVPHQPSNLIAFLSCPEAMAVLKSQINSSSIYLIEKNLYLYVVLLSGHV